MKRTLAIVMVLGFVLSATALAGDDPSIKGKTREGIQMAMKQHVEVMTAKGSYLIYDAITDNLLKLKFEELHKGIVKKDGWYVSCADFSAGQNKYDLDFLVTERDGAFYVFDVIVHKVNGTKRPYTLEGKKAESK